MSDWYNSAGWYTPLHETRQPEPVGPERVLQPVKQKKKARTARIIGAIVILLAIIIGTSVAFSKPHDTPVVQPATSEGKDKDSSAKNDSSADSGLPGDFKDFFENYYTTTDSTPAVVDIERTTVNGATMLQMNPASGEELSLKELYAQCLPTIVGIKGYAAGSLGYNWGTGFILSSDGIIVTNTHVIDGTEYAEVILNDGTVYEAKLIGADTTSDLAVLKIEASGLPVVTLGDSRELVVGDKVAAIGNPLGESFTGTLTDGIISAIERGVSYKGRTMTLLQTNTALNEGNSGGPLFNMYGQVIGVTNMKMMSSYSSIEGIGFAIPSATVVEIVNALLENGEVRGRTSIGITVGGIPDAAKKQYKLPEGLYIAGVQSGSDAEKQGLQVGDVITEVNGIHVTTTDEIAAIKDQYKVGDKLTFTIYRQGETFDVDVELMDTNDVYGG